MKIAPVPSLLISSVCLLLAACGQEPVPQAPPPGAAPPAAVTSEIKVIIQPAQPTSGDCLRVMLRGQPERPVYRWEVNGQRVAADQPGELCSGAFRRGDRVTLHVGTANAGGSAAVTIGNSPPRVTGISATPKELFAGMDAEVFPVAEDRDGDPVGFRYQWLINGEADPVLTDARIPGTRFVKGDRIMVTITPYDGQSEGPVYQSYTMPIPNAPPQIVSQPPQKFEAMEYSYQFKARDPDGDKLVYKLEKAPAGMTVNRATGLVAWPLAGVKAGTYPVKIVVSDPDGAAVFQEYTLTLGAPASAAAAAKKP